MSPEGRDHSFDELTRGLASGTLSRGKALRLMGAALVGGALASIPGIALAKPKPAGAKCNHDHQCASGNCFIRVGGGFCFPPEGPNLVECDCMGDSFLNLCSAACGSDAHQVCVAFCAPHGGLEDERCGPHVGCGAS
jgi:hypothetical protein